MQNIKSYLTDNKERFINELIELLKIPSISADSAFSQDMLNTAEAVAAALTKAGCEAVEICETKGYPHSFWRKKCWKSPTYRPGIWSLRCAATRSLRSLGLSSF